MEDFMGNKVDLPDIDLLNSGIDELLHEAAQQKRHEQRSKIQQALQNKYFGIEETIQFFEDENFTRQSLANFVAGKVLTPCFFYEGTLIRMCKSGTAEPDFQNGKVNFSGYITPLEGKAINRLMRQASNCTYVLKVKLVEPTNLSERTIREEPCDEEGNLIGFDHYHDYDAVDYYQVSDDCNYDFSDQGVELYPSDCVFQESMLKNIITEILIDQKLSVDELTIKDEFAPAVLKALEQLGEDPKALPKYNPKHKSGVRSKVKEILKANPKTKYLVDEDETFNKYWQDLRVEKILVEKI